ncbi:type II toxin-antitoxin system VapC family toxin [Limnohabitans sp. DM1]|uniref:type II toxin-antitoxin system VapC family toxin n=1 Tax=Limnohabitans sp. DM1 TaxID=1597955 RepID=UPI000AE55815|nr:type II toxin-antitoxin system VapC family toxin [Limnohabitans sp. DM1]
MIILDTNLVSEPLKPLPHPGVVHWLNAQEPATLFITSINLAELLAGVETMPQGKRRDALARVLANQVSALFEDRVLNFNASAAQCFATCLAGAQAQGNSVGFADCAIAAIAKTHGFIVATHNVRDFQGMGVELVNPWALN